MPRAALFTLLVAFAASESLPAQRMRMMIHEGRSEASHGGFAGRGALPNRSGLRHFHGHHENSGSFFLPYLAPDYAPYDEPMTEENVTDGRILASPTPTPERQVTTPERPAVKPLVIEIPTAANSTPARALQPTVFVLANGERVEVRRFVLTVSNLSFSVNRQQRTVPLELLDITATLSANRERGIDLRVPVDSTEISMSF